MRVFGWMVLLLLMATSALAQMGVRTGRPTIANTQVKAEESARAGQPAKAQAADNRTTVRMELEPATASEPDAAACVAGVGAFPTLRKNGAASDRTSCFWDQKGQEYLKYARFISSSKTAGIATDVISDTIGPFRLVLSTAVAATTSEDDDTGDGGETDLEEGEDDDEPTSAEDKALSLLGANGGNLAITAALPLYYTPIGNGQFLWNSWARVAGNVQAFGEEGTSSRFSDTNANLELAFSEWQLGLLTDQQKFNILGYAKTSAIVGTKKFSETIGDPSRTFFHGQLGAGVRIADKLDVYLTYNWYSDGKIPGDGTSIAFSMAK